jgi:predicted nucleic acid-binding protein
MTTAIDTNIIVALWDPEDALNSIANWALDSAVGSGATIVSAPVFAELIAIPQGGEKFVENFLYDTGITIDWHLDETIWRTAGRAFQAYAARRRKQKDSGPRRILADFLIGAHALERGCRFLTLDAGLYRAAFPKLEIQTV